MNIVSQYQSAFTFRVKQSKKSGMLNPEDEDITTLIQK